VLVARQAREDRRHAVLAMDPVEESLPALREYIAGNPGETAVQERLDEVTQAIEQDRKLRADPGYRAQREGLAALEAGRIEEAQGRLQEALARRPNDGEAVGALGLVRLRQGRHAEAIEQFRRARRLDRANAGRWNGLIRTARYWGLLQQAAQAREAGQLDAAEARVREARAIDPKEPNAAVELARIHLAAGRDREAEALLGELTPAQREQVGESIAAMRAGRLRDRAKQLQAQGRRAEAIAALEQGAALDPLDPWMRHDLARLYAAAGERERGQALFDDLLRRRPGDADARYAFALFLSGIERESQALEVLEGVAAGERTAGMTRLQRRLWITVQGRRAVAYAAAGEAGHADAVMASMNDAIGGDRGLAIEVARVLDRMGADAQLRALLDRIATLGAATPEQRETLGSLALDLELRRARALRAAGRVDEAAESYREVLRANPADTQARLSLIEMLVERGEVDAAQPLIEAALRAQPDDPRALAAAGRIAQRNGRIDEAIAYEQRSLAGEASGGQGWRYRRLAEMLDQRLTLEGAALDWLYRSGSAGKSQISAQELPLAHRQAWGDSGQWLLRVVPARVKSGLLDTANPGEVATFGSLLLCMPLCSAAPLVSVEEGVAVSAGFERDRWRFDLGTSPIGFPVVNLVGGLVYKGDWGSYSYSIDASRRAMTSSLLSYAGMRDPNTGRTWGGVVTTGVRLNVSRDSGGEYGAWGLAGLYRLSGRNVQDNDKAELMAGAYRRLINEDNRQLALGLTGMLWHFSENAGEFTFGHGGYYSPRSFRSLSVPLSYALRGARTSYFVRAALSVSWSESRSAPFFPTDAQLQAQAEALSATNGIDPFYGGGGNGRSFGRSLAAAVEHQLAPNVFVGGRMDLERSTNYTPNRFLLYVRFTPGAPAARPVSLPPDPVLFGSPY
jgi:tetratricopeptide (TPR) repeat protein